MTTTMPMRPASALNPTRQQLDELDALLQRMLELPVQPLDRLQEVESEGPEPEPPFCEAILGEEPVDTGRSPSHQPADAYRSPSHQPADAYRSPSHQPADAGCSPSQRPSDAGRSPSTLRVSLPPVSYTVVETASPRPLPPASGFEPRPSMLAPRLVPVSPPETPTALPPVAEGSEAEAWVPLRSTWQPSPSTWPPLAASWHQANSGTAPADSEPIVESHPDATPPLPAELELPVEIPLSLPVHEQPLGTEDSELQTESEPQVSLPAEDAPARVAWPLLPLVWFNQGFDACLGSLGASGRWLCGRGRIVFGFLGLACLAGAAAVALSSGMGWSW